MTEWHCYDFFGKIKFIQIGSLFHEIYAYKHPKLKSGHLREKKISTFFSIEIFLLCNQVCKCSML